MHPTQRDSLGASGHGDSHHSMLATSQLLGGFENIPACPRGQSFHVGLEPLEGQLLANLEVDKIGDVALSDPAIVDDVPQGGFLAIIAIG